MSSRPSPLRSTPPRGPSPSAQHEHPSRTRAERGSTLRSCVLHLRRLSPRALGSLALVLGLPLASCGDVDAILELELDLPTDPDRIAVVQARREPVGFEDAWDGSGIVAFPLDGADDPRISIVSDGEYEQPLLVRVRYCSSTACDALGDERAPESRLIVERAFYLGERTAARWSIPTVPSDPAPAPETIGRCEVRGCRDGVAASHCRMDGTHFCE